MDGGGDVPAGGVEAADLAVGGEHAQRDLGEGVVNQLRKLLRAQPKARLIVLERQLHGRVDAVAHDRQHGGLVATRGQLLHQPVDLLTAALRALQDAPGIQHHHRHRQLGQKSSRLRGRDAVDRADGAKHLGPLQRVRGGEQARRHQGREGTRVHGNYGNCGHHQRVRDGFHVRRRHAVGQQNARAALAQLPDPLAQRLHAVCDVVQMHGRHGVFRLLLKQRVRVGEMDRAFGVLGRLGQPQGHAADQQVPAHQRPARGGKHRHADGHVFLSQHVQKRLRLAAQVTAQRAVDALGIEPHLIGAQRLQALPYPRVRLLARDGAAVGRHHQAVALLERGGFHHGVAKQGHGVESAFFQQNAGRVRAGQIVGDDDAVGHNVASFSHAHGVISRVRLPSRRFSLSLKTASVITPS